MTENRWIRVFRSRNHLTRENTYVLSVSNGYFLRTTSERGTRLGPDDILWEVTNQSLVWVPGGIAANEFAGYSEALARSREQKDVA